MKVIRILIIVIVALLSIAAGVAKLMQAPHEMEFLQRHGLSTMAIMVFGAVQIVAGVLLAWQRTRITGATLAITAFVLSALLIFKDGNIAFGLISLLPILLAAIVVYQTAAIMQTKGEG